MILVGIINFFLALIGNVIAILWGVLLIRHRQCIAYFKNTFTFIKDDYQPELEVNYGNFFSESFEAFKYGIKFLGKNSSALTYGKDKTFEINQILVLIGKLLIALGVFGIIVTIISSFWMLFTSRF
ncbi:hypothetical protein AAFN75_11315 [Algibacter sp. AS12]|uniref:hypothetical protein n=1 Tax=Algibacter sp. AS12 TaxID=3135773 RepID=UPI00398B8AD4